MGPNGRPGVESYVPVAAFYEGKRELAGEAFSDRFAVLEWNGVDLRVLAARGKDLAPGTVLPLSREDAACLRDAVWDGAAVLLPCGAILFGKAAIDEFCRKGITNDQLVDLIKKVFEMINGNRDLDDDDVDEISDEDGMVATTNRSKK